jgi:tetratricopeptide (TPR) repeat protein
MGMALAVLVGAGSAWGHAGVPREIEELDQRLAMRPGDAGLLVQRAALWRRVRRLDEAEKDVAAAEAKEPGRADVLFERGSLLLERGEYAGAEETLSRCVESGGTGAALFRARGQAREKLGKLEEAHSDYDAAFRARPDPDTALVRGRVDEAARKLDRAAAEYEAALSALSGATVLRMALVRVERARGRMDAALGHIEAGMASAQLKGDWLLLRAEVLETAGKTRDATADRKEALREADEALVRRPSDLRRLVRAKALLALGKRSDAIAELSKVVASSPGLDEATRLLALARAGKAKP